MINKKSANFHPKAALSQENRIHACWLGKSIGGTLGLPAEGRMERLNYSFYDPVPTSAPPNDDLELQLVWLDLVENLTSSLSQSDFARAWLDHIHYMWDEYGRCRWNLRRGVAVESVGTFENHFHAGMGSPIRSEIWACFFPGDPESAAHYAVLDASLDHGNEGIAGEVFFSAMQSLVLDGNHLSDALTHALQFLPSQFETVQAVSQIMQDYEKGIPTWTSWQQLLDRHGNENFTHAPLNVALTVWALLYGKGDFEKSILLATNGGYDTDCTAATVGATLGLMLGSEHIPSRWSDPIGEGVFVGPGIIGINAPKTLAELTERTQALIGKLEPRPWDHTLWERSTPVVELSNLPGSFLLTPADESHSVPWSNGELPETVKQAGGASWSWEPTNDEPREIICLARFGGKLFIDDELLIECPSNLPYVPATHRSPGNSRITVKGTKDKHTMRLELNSNSPTQEASVTLAYPNLHIAPWTKGELPHQAILPTP